MNLSQLEKEENMFRAFAHFDTDNSGYITEDELEAALRVRRAVHVGLRVFTGFRSPALACAI